MKAKIICTLILLTIFSCKKDKAKSYKEELTESIQKRITQELKQGSSSLESIRLVKFDTLREWQEADLLLQYSNHRLVILNKQQQQLTSELDGVKNENDLERIKLKYGKVKDSIKHEMKIAEIAGYLNPREVKTGNYQVVFLLKILDQKSNKVKSDSLFMYLNEKKVIFTQSQFIERCIVKFKQRSAA